MSILIVQFISDVESAMMVNNQVKLFQSVQKFYRTMGLLPIETSKSNPKFLFFLFSMTLLLTSVTAFLLLEVTNMKDFGMAFYGTVTDLNILIDFIITVWQIPTIFNLIKLSEGFIEQSELHSNGACRPEGTFMPLQYIL